MSSINRQLNIYDLPDFILERICQNLLYDPELNHSWFDCGIIHLLRFRATGSYFNQVIKASCLKFSLFIDFCEFTYNEYHHLEYISSFLSWANSDLNWKCTGLKLGLPLDNPDDPQSICFLGSYLSKLRTFEKVFSRRIKYLSFDALFHSAGYCEAIKALSDILSPDVIIIIQALISDFKGMSALPFRDRIKILDLQVFHDPYMKQPSSFAIVFVNLTSLSIDCSTASSCRDIPNITLPPSCTTLRIDIRLLHCFINCHFIKHLQVLLKSRSNDMPLLEKFIEKFVFQLEIFVIGSKLIGSVSGLDCFNAVGTSLLKSQQNLKALAIDLFCEKSPAGLDYNFFCLNQQEITELEQLIEREQELFKSHPSLQYFRMKDYFVVLKMSIDGSLLRLINYLDTEYDWRVARLDFADGYSELLAFRRSRMTIT